MIYVLTLVFLFITRIRFPSNKPISQVITSRYGRDVLRTIRKFEKLNFKRRKLELDLDFLTKCLDQRLQPTFLRFRVSNRNLRQSHAYRTCQMNLLQEEIRNKESTIQQLTRQEENLKRAIRLQVSIIDFAHISSFMLSHNDKILNRVKLVHERKLLKIGFKSIEEGHDPQRVIFNFSSHDRR